MSSHDKYKQHFILLLEAGFIAVNQMDEESALRLFRASEILNPHSTLPAIGRGYLHFHKLELGKAIETFNAVLKKDPHNEMAKAFKGMCLSLTPDHCAEGEKILHEVAESAHGKEVRSAAKTSLEFVDKFVKKSPSPAEIQKKK